VELTLSTYRDATVPVSSTGCSQDTEQFSNCQEVYVQLLSGDCLNVGKAVLDRLFIIAVNSMIIRQLSNS
jgi:hypothetical protein